MLFPDGLHKLHLEEFHAAVSADADDESMHLDLGILVKKKAQANIRDAATGRLFLVVFLLCEFNAFALRSPRCGLTTVFADPSLTNKILVIRRSVLLLSFIVD